MRPPLPLSQHPNQHRPQRPALLAAELLGFLALVAGIALAEWIFVKAIDALGRLLAAS